MPQTETAATGVHEFFSLADAGQYEQEIIENYRGDLDANASLPPLPHDVYSVRVRYAEKWPDGEVLRDDPGRRWKKQFAKDSQLMYLTWIEVITENNANPDHDGRVRTEVMTTYPNKRGITGTQALLQGLGIDTVTLNSHQAQMIAVDEAIGGEGGMAGQELDWEASVYDKEMVQRDGKTGNTIKDANGDEKRGVELWKLRGMKKFPMDAEGAYVPEIGPKDGHSYQAPGPDGKPTGERIVVMEARARNFMRRWVPIGKLQGADSGQRESVAETLADPRAAQARVAAPAQPPAAAAQRPAAPQAQAAPARAAAPTRPGAPRRVQP